MKRLFITLLLVPFFTAKADQLLPTGCYVSFANPGVCYEVPSGTLLAWVTATDPTILASNYGQAVAIIIAKFTEIMNGRNACVSDLLSLQTDYDNLSSQLASTDANRQEWIKYGQAKAGALDVCLNNSGILSAGGSKMMTLITKLRRACGTKCKRIK